MVRGKSLTYRIGILIKERGSAPAEFDLELTVSQRLTAHRRAAGRGRLRSSLWHSELLRQPSLTSQASLQR